MQCSTLHVLLVDDDPVVLRVMEKACQRISDVSIIGTAVNGADALDRYHNQRIDLLISDVSMPEVNGLELAQSFHPRPYVILTSSSWEFAVDAFSAGVMDFLLKPLTLPRLKQAFDRVRADQELRKQPHTPHLFIRHNRRLVRLNLDEVRLIEALGDYVAFHVNGRRYMVHTTLKEIEARISHPDWLRVHRSYLVNLAHVVDIEDSSLVVEEHVVPISRSNRPRLMARIQTIG